MVLIDILDNKNIIDNDSSALIKCKCFYTLKSCPLAKVARGKTAIPTPLKIDIIVVRSLKQINQI